MKSNNDPVKQENKKAMPKFILISVLAAAGGAVLGVVLVMLDFENIGDAMASTGLFFTIHAAPWLLIALPIAELAVCLPLYFGAKKQLAHWDGEDEDISCKIELKLSVVLWITCMATILSFFLAAAQFSGFVDMEGNPMELSPVKFIGGLAAFLVTLYASAVVQQKAVDATKQMNPEKRGSVYDVKFQKKWLDSCDEAERAIIGQCALKAYYVMNRTCLVLWAVLALGGMFFSWGFMPAMAVCVVWGVGQSVYSYSCIKLSNPGSSSAL